MMAQLQASFRKIYEAAVHYRLARICINHLSTLLKVPLG